MDAAHYVSNDVDTPDLLGWVGKDAPLLVLYVCWLLLGCRRLLIGCCCDVR
jgi:hypothetical protein